jgi:hypothetical protein
LFLIVKRAIKAQSVVIFGSSPSWHVKRSPFARPLQHRRQLIAIRTSAADALNLVGALGSNPDAQLIIVYISAWDLHSQEEAADLIIHCNKRSIHYAFSC